MPPAQVANRENARVVLPKQRDTLFHRTGLLERHRSISSNRTTTLTCQESTRSKMSGLSPVCTCLSRASIAPRVIIRGGIFSAKLCWDLFDTGCCRRVALKVLAGLFLLLMMTETSSIKGQYALQAMLAGWSSSRSSSWKACGHYLRGAGVSSLTDDSHVAANQSECGHEA